MNLQDVLRELNKIDRNYMTDPGYEALNDVRSLIMEIEDAIGEEE